MAQVCHSLNACAVRADLPSIQLARPFQLVSSHGVLCSLHHPPSIISHHIRRLQHRLHRSNHAQHVPSPPGQPFSLQLHFSFVLGRSVCRSLRHPSSTISHHIQHLQHCLHRSNHTQCVPLPPGHPLGLQLHFGFVIVPSIWHHPWHLWWSPGMAIFLPNSSMSSNKIPAGMTHGGSYPGSTFLNP